MASNKKTKLEITNTEKTSTNQSMAVDDASIKDNTKLHRLLVDEIPDSVLRRYAIKDHLYYSKDRTKGLAFEDKGKSISAKTSDADDIRAMIELAKAKNWSKIRISGTDEFRKEVWIAASMQGLEVEGYTPSAQDVALLEDTKRRIQNKIEFAEPRVAIDQDKTQAQKEVELAADKTTADKSVKFKYTAYSKPSAAEVAIIEAAKAKGASPKLQASMKQKLTVAVSQLKAMGIEIPKPKIYDTKVQVIGDKTAIDAMDSSTIQKRITQPQVAPRR